MQIPHTALSPEALQNLLEEFVTREGTEYGLHDYSLVDKVRQVRRQIETGRAVILYDPETSTCHIEVRERIPPESGDPADTSES
ncbi:MAG: YheU family protein [Gammaproteobacteria bacterium]